MTVLKICTGRACDDHGSAYLFDRAKAERPDLKAEPCPCLSLCRHAVNVKIETQHKTVIHSEVTGPKLAQIIKKLS